MAPILGCSDCLLTGPSDVTSDSLAQFSADQEPREQDGHNNTLRQVGFNKMGRTAAADELCEYCQVSLEFFSNINRYFMILSLNDQEMETVADIFTT